jgi:peptidoglycan/LPS O-acetylase OafA/YrhL
MFPLRDRRAVTAGSTQPRVAPAAPYTPTARRLIELDSLRGMAALVVVLFHFTTFHEKDVGFAGRPSLDFWWGDNGVEVFFVISGFVIFMTLDNTKRGLDFVVSRFSRLYPAYWAAILFTTATVLLAGFEQYYRSPGELVVNFTMVQRLPGLATRDVDWSYWTLYTELLFYLAMLGLFVTGQIRRIEAYLVAALIGALVFPALEMIVADAPADSVEAAAVRSIQFVVPFAPLFVAGICLHRLWTGTKPRTAAAILAAAVATAWLTLTGVKVVAMLSAIVTIGLILTGRARLLRLRPFVWLGGISYSLYLVHSTAGRAVIVRLEAIGWSADAAIVVALAFAFAAAILINHYVEKPAQSWLRDAYKRRVSAAQPSGFAPAAPR